MRMTAGALDLVGWLRLTLTPGIGAETQRALLAACGLPDVIYATAPGVLRGVIGPAQTERLLHPDSAAQARIDTAIAATLDWAALPGNHVLTLADREYPQALLQTADPPTLLYAKGRIELLNHPALAIVGSRNATVQGAANAEAFAAVLAAAGLTIVSGMALGIDTAAHRGALTAAPDTSAEGSGAATIAVIGTGIDRVYPARNRDLARQIAERGVIISEFPLGTPALAGNFPRRNRLIAGLGRGCLVVEAAARSGSLITARLAAEMGREVFALPGSIHAPLAKGCHQLIKQGAKLVETAQDVLEELGGPVSGGQAERRKIHEPLPEPTSEEVVDAEGKQVLAALGHDPCTIDALIDRSGLTTDALLAILLRLELDGCVAPLPGSRYQRLSH
jgi:DNA processing protein